MASAGVSNDSTKRWDKRYYVPREVILARPLPLTATSGRRVQGAISAPVTVTIDNIGPTALLHVGWIGLASPGLPLSLVGLPATCGLHASLDVIVDTTTVSTASLVWSPLMLPALPPSFAGLEFYVQSATLGAGNLSPDGRASNGLKYVIGPS